MKAHRRVQLTRYNRKVNILGLLNDLRSDLDQLFLQRGRGPVLPGPRQRQPPRSVSLVVRQGEWLEPGRRSSEVVLVPWKS